MAFAAVPAGASPAEWVNSIKGVKPNDQFVALDRRLLEDCIARALAAAPTVASEEDGKDALIAKLQQRGATELDVILRLTVQLRDALDAIRDLLPATGNAYHPAYAKGAKVLRAFEESKNEQS
jgi:hypothetical protein